MLSNQRNHYNTLNVSFIKAYCKKDLRKDPFNIIYVKDYKSLEKTSYSLYALIYPAFKTKIRHRKKKSINPPPPTFILRKFEHLIKSPTRDRRINCNHTLAYVYMLRECYGMPQINHRARRRCQGLIIPIENALPMQSSPPLEHNRECTCTYIYERASWLFTNAPDR